jgi:hypothetical protein
VAAYNHDQIVKVVDDSTGEPAQRRHLLRPLQGLLHLFLPGNVDYPLQYTFDFAPVITKWNRGKCDLDRLADLPGDF